MIIKRKIFDLIKPYEADREAIIITGFRRVGKTYTLQYIFDQIRDLNKIFLDLESPVNQRIFQTANYDQIKFGFTQIGLDLSRKAYVFLDEIQYVKNLPSIVKYLLDHGDIKFYLTGSSSFYLKNQFSESLSGRKYIFELYPLDFEEFLWFKDSRLTPQSNPEYLCPFYQEYLEFGGFPGVVLEPSTEKKILKIDDVLGSYFEQDVKSFSHFRDNQNLKNLLFLLGTRTGNKIDVTKIAESLGVSRQTVYEYLNFYEQTYLISLIKPFSASSDVQIRTTPKLYFNDTGLLKRIGQVSPGQLLENKVFNQLFVGCRYAPPDSALSDPINYYHRSSGGEIDFIVRRKKAYEVKQAGTQYDLRKVERLSRKLGIDDFRLVSFDAPPKPDPRIIFPYDLG
jgi:hypothetical protein